MAADDPQKQGKTTATGVVSPNNATKKPKERVPVKPDLTEINQYLMCSLCSGYLIDATAIIECQHTFCKSCILKYLETNGYCPICDIELNTVKPHLSLRSDVIVQRLVYKLVPGLLVSELRRRRDHALDTQNVKAAEFVSDEMAMEVDAASDVSTILSLDDVVSLSIEYFVGKSSTTDAKEAIVKPKQQFTPQKQEQQQSPANDNPKNNIIQDVSNSKDTTEANDRRYLKCPAAVSVGLLKKFIRMKYGLSDDYRVDLLYNGVRDNSLENDLTLLDVAFVFKWNKDEPMHFHYRIFDRNAKSLTSRAGTKRSASSMMDEPPDDDAASGPQNRPMTSASPSSKIPRVSNNTSTAGANNNRGNTGGSYNYRSTSSQPSSAPVYDFTEGNSDTDEPIQKGKLKLRNFRKNSGSSPKNAKESIKAGSQASKKSPSYASRAQSYEDKAIEVGRSESSGSTSSNRRCSGTSNYRGRSNSVGTSGNEVHSEDEDADSDTSTESDDAKNTDLTNSRVRSAAQTVMQSQVNGTVKLNLSSGKVEKREPLKLSLGSVLAKSPEHRHKHKHHKLKHRKKHKQLKISLPLNPSGSNSHTTTSQANHMQNNHKSGGKSVKVIGEKGTKLIFGIGQNKSADSKGPGNGPSGNANSQSNFPVNVKATTSAHLNSISKSISVSIGVGNSSQNNSGGNVKQTQQLNKNLTPTTNIPPKKTGIEIQTANNKLPSSGVNAQPNSNNSSSNCNQSSTSRSHPLLPESVHVPKSVTLIPVNPNGTGSTGSSSSVRGSSSGNVTEKSGSSSNNSTSNRLNAHTFTHPITNKSLHQITVHQVPAPPKSGSPVNGGNVGMSANNAVNNANNNNNASPNIMPTNPIEKVIANAANKPQFSGPGSMEITKIYCGAKENAAKKLKERKGLDISITGPGLNSMKDKKQPNKLEETLRQKMGLGTTMTINNKIKGNSQPPGPLGFNATKMPPGITIGPAGMNKTTSGSSNSNSTNSANTIPGLGFTLPPHITAHPQHPPKPNTTNPMKQTDRPIQHKNLAGGGIGGKNHGMPNNKTKDSIPISQKHLSNKVLDNRKKLGEAMMDMANRNSLKSPSPPLSKNCQQNKNSGKASGKSNNNLVVNCEKRALDMSSSSRKNSRDSPDLKRSKTNDSANPKSSTNESPLDLSSRPNSNSSSPIHQMKTYPTSSPSTEKARHNESQSHFKKSPTPVPKVSPPTTTSSGFPSPSSSSSSSPGNTGGKSTGLQKQPSTPTGSSSISTIAQALAQKQLSQQQAQQQQNLHNQIMQLHQGLVNMHNQQQTVVGNQSKPGGSLSVGNSLSPKGGMSGLSAGSSLSSHSPPMIQMPNPSPPGTSFDPLRNLLTLSDAAVRHGKGHPMSNLMAAAVGMCQPQPHAHHTGLSLPSPTSVTSGSLFPHLVNSLGGVKSNGMLDHSTNAYLAAISFSAAQAHAHNERLAAAAGMSHFGDSPMPMSNSFFSQVRPPSSNNPHGGLIRIPSVTPKSNSANNNSSSSGSGKKSSPTPPLAFSPIVSAPHSPTKVSSASPVSISSSSSSAGSPHTKSQDPSSLVHGKSSIKLNGTSFSSHLPILPPGIHNPLLPNYSRSPATTNLISSFTTSNTSSYASTSTKVTNSDKKGIPNSMKISNFLPNKPKDGKGTDTTNVEATITSNVGGSSLTKFLNSIPPLIVSSAQTNLSTSSSSTLPKDSSRVCNAFNNKSSNEQDCLSKSKSLSSSHSKTVSPNALSPNQIKKEMDQPIIPSSTPLKFDPITTCHTNAPTPKSSSSKVNQESSKLNSFEIKSEGASLISSKGGPLASAVPLVGLSSPPTGRATQSQNQAVRHIPNPALLFNRQNSSSGQIGGRSNSSDTSPPFSQNTLPLKLEDHHNHSVPMPALPFPGVSVPVQVKVDNDALPIPIKIVDNVKQTPTILNELEKTTEALLVQAEHDIEDKKPTTFLSLEQTTSSTASKNELNAELPTKENISEQNEQPNQICKEEEIVKIEYMSEDADLDIDVGIEIAPIFPSNDDNNHHEVDEKMEQAIAPITSSESMVQIISNEPQSETKCEQIESITPTTTTFHNEITKENIGDTNETVESEVTASAPALISAEQIQQVEEESCLVGEKVEENKVIIPSISTSQDEEKAALSVVSLESLEEKMDIECATEKEEENVRQDETGAGELSTNSSSETLPIATESEMKTDEQMSTLMMEVQDEEKSSLSDLVPEIEKVQPEQNSEEIGQLPNPTLLEAVATSDIERVNEVVSSPKAVIEDCNMEIDEEIVPILITDEKEEVVEPMEEQECENDQQILIKPLDHYETLPSAENDAQSSLITEAIQEAKEQETETIPEILDTLANNENDLLASEVHADKNSDIIELQTDLKLVSTADSNLIPYQIIINPEALQVEDTNSMEICESSNLPVVNTKDTKEMTEQSEEYSTEQVAEEKLMESSSASQLELNCPSADTNGIELSNPVTIATLAEPCLSSIEQHIETEEACMSKKSEDAEAETQVFELKVVDTSNTILTTSTDNLEIPSNANADNISEEENCQDIDSTSQVDQVVACETSHAPNNQIIVSQVEEMEVMDFDKHLQTPDSELLISLEDNSNLVPAFISATATITTTSSSEMSAETLDVSSIESPVSCRNSLESPTSPDDTKKLETLEKVAAGLFATAANNNNNTSLTMNTDISISTNDLATV